mgnify:CR=1 FL=1
MLGIGKPRLWTPNSQSQTRWIGRVGGLKRWARHYTHLMADREACERRVFRLAMLLTGNPDAAVKVIKQVIAAQPDLRNVDGAHMDRLTVLRCREVKAVPLNVPGAAVGPDVAEALAKLPAQQREAWVFSKVYRMDLREMSRAMDCSTTAIAMHQDQADEAMMRWLGVEARGAADQLLRYSQSLDVPGVHRALRIRDEKMRLVLMRALIVMGALGLIIGCVWLVRVLSRG